MKGESNPKKNKLLLFFRQILHLLKMTLKVYRERGFLALLQRIREYLKGLWEFTFFCIKTGKADVLYISGCPGGSRLYRCYNQAEELENYGIKSAVISQNDFILLNLSERFSVFVFQRVVFNENIGAVLKDLKKLGKTVIFETDDLVFDPHFTAFMCSPMTEEEKKWYQNGIGREILEDPYAKHCVVSTDYLKRIIKERYPEKRVFVSYNKMGRKQVVSLKKALANKKPKNQKERVCIGYFSGSRSHNKDFETVKGAILRILKENKNIVLKIVGYLELSQEFDNFKKQIEQLNFVSFNKLAEIMLSCQINIAPLEIDNPFCQAKSGLKFFEAGILGIPTIASATDSFRYLIKNGENGFLAENENDWYNSLNSLIKDKDLRERMGKQARREALKKHTVLLKHKQTEEYVSFLKSRIYNEDEE